jgi:hypothetical protein
MTDYEANSLVRGLVFAVQKSRSDMSEALGGDQAGDELLEYLHPWLFGPDSMLPRLLDWQARARAQGVITGLSLFNWVKFIDLKDRMILGLLPLYGYTEVPLEGPPIEWTLQTWPYLTDGLGEQDGTASNANA